MVRKPVSAVYTGSAVVVVCDDGSVWDAGDWTRIHKHKDHQVDWVSATPIPGTDADESEG